MLDTAKFMIKGAIANRKGATALEYALIAGALAAVTLAGFKAFFSKINTFLNGIAIS